MEVLTPLADKGSSPARSIAKMHTIIANHQEFIDQILQALLTCNPQNSQFTNQITKIQNDFKKSLEENNIIDNNTKTLNTSFKNFVETTEANLSCIKIDIDQLNKQNNENCEVLTTMGANLQSLRDDFELYKMRRSTPSSPRKKNDLNDTDKIKADVESLKNALEVVNENYAPLDGFENAVNEIKKLNEITKKLDDANLQKQIQDLTKTQQDLAQKEANQAQQINKIENAQNAQDEKLQQSANQISKLENAQNTQEGKLQQTTNQINKIENTQNAQEEKLQQSANQISKLENTQNTQEGKLQQTTNQINQIENTQKAQEEKLQQSANQISKLENTQNTQEEKLRQSANQISKLENTQNTQEEKLQQSANQISKLENTQNTQEEKLQQSANQISKLENTQNTQEGKLQQTTNQINKIENSQNTQEGKLQQTTNQINKIENTQNAQEEKLQQSANQISKLENTQNTQEEKLQQSANQISKLENTQITQEGKLQQATNQINQIENTQKAQEEKLQQSTKELNELKSQLEEIKNSLSQNRDIPPSFDKSDIQSINQRLDKITGSQSITDQNINTINSNLEEQQAKYLNPLMDRVNKLENQLNEMKELQEAISQNHIVSRDINISELPDFDSINQRLNELASSQNKTIETVNALNSKLEEQQKHSVPSEEINDLHKRIDEIENANPQSNGLDVNEVLQIPEISDAISMKELVNEIISSQTKTINTVNALNSKLQEQQTKYTNPLLDRVNAIEEQLNQLDNLQDRIDEIGNGSRQSNGLDKDEILQIPEISDVVSMRDLVNEIASSQTKTINAVNALNSKLQEQQTKYTNPLLDRVNAIEEQLNQLEDASSAAINSDEISLLQEKINNLGNPDAADISSIQERLDELAASQYKTIETVNALNSKLEEQQTKYSHPLLQRVGQIEEQLNLIDTNQEEIQNIQTRDINLNNDDNLDEIQQNIELLSSKQQDMIRDLKSQKSKLNNLDEDYSSLQGQITELFSKLSSLENDKSNKNQKFSLPSFSSDDNEDGEDENNGTTDSKLRKRVSKLEKIVAHLMPAQELKMKMIPIDFVDEVDLANETPDETLRRHNREISVLAKDFIVLSNEVIDIQGELNERKFKGDSQNERQKTPLNSEPKFNNDDLDAIKTRVEEIASFYSKLHEANKQLVPHIRQHQSDINILTEKQKSLEDQFDQFEQLHEAEINEIRESSSTRTKNDEDDSEIKTRQINIQKVPDYSNDLSALELRANELTSAFATIRDTNNALIDRLRKIESDISLLMARQNQMEEQSSQSEHEHGRHVKRVKKHRRRRHQYEEEDEDENENVIENENDNENKEDETQIEDRDAENDQKQNLDEIVNRLNVVSSNNAKLVEACNAIKSHLIQQHEEIRGIPKMTSDIRCIKHELRKILSSQDEIRPNNNSITTRSINNNNDDDNEEEETSRTNNTKLREIESALNSIIDSQKDVINNENRQTERIEKQQEQVNKQLAAIRSLSTQLKDEDSKLQEIQTELSKLRNVIQNIKDDQNDLKNTQERSLDLEQKQPSLPSDIIETIEGITRRIDDIEDSLKNSPKPSSNSPKTAEIESKLDDHERQINRLTSATKKIVDNTNCQTSYITSQNSMINQISSEFGDSLNRLEKVEHTMRCLKYEVRKLKSEQQTTSTNDNDNDDIEKVAAKLRSVQNNGQIEAKLNEHEQAIGQIVDRMAGVIENSNIHSDRLQKQQFQINQQTAAIKSIVENRIKPNLNDNLVGGTSSFNKDDGQLRREIEDLKHAVEQNSNDSDNNNASLHQLHEDLQRLERKVQQIEQSAGTKARDSPNSRGSDEGIDQIASHLNSLESSQKIVIQNANAQIGHIKANRSKLTEIEAKIDQIDERLDFIESNKEDVSNLQRTLNEISQNQQHPSQPQPSSLSENDRNMLKSILSSHNELIAKMAEQSDTIDSLKRQLNSVIENSQKQPQITTTTNNNNAQEIADLQESVSSLHDSIKVIESKLKNNFIKITEAHQKIANRFEKVSKDIKSLRETTKSLTKQQQQQQQDDTISVDITQSANNSRHQEREITVDIDRNTNENDADIDTLIAEFHEFKKSQEQLNRSLLKMIDETSQNASQQIQKAVKNELVNQRNSPKNQNQNPNVQTDIFTLKKEIDTLKINEIRKEISSIKNEQKRILSSINRPQSNIQAPPPSSSTSNADERGRIEAITSRVNQMKDEMIEISSKLKKNDEFVKSELASKAAELSSNADEIEEAKKLANRIVKIVKGHDEKLKKLKDHIDFQDGVLSEITGRDIRMISSRPTTPK